MKTHEILYIISIFLIILSTSFYLLSTTIVPGSEEDSVANIFGKNTELDSTLSEQDNAVEFQELERERNSIFLWIGILGGVLIFFIALVLKRIKHGADLFIDRYDDEDLDFF